MPTKFCDVRVYLYLYLGAEGGWHLCAPAAWMCPSNPALPRCCCLTCRCTTCPAHEGSRRLQGTREQKQRQAQVMAGVLGDEVWRGRRMGGIQQELVRPHVALGGAHGRSLHSANPVVLGMYDCCWAASIHVLSMWILVPASPRYQPTLLAAPIPAYTPRKDA
jgi:hypothetical protein